MSGTYFSWRILQSSISRGSGGNCFWRRPLLPRWRSSLPRATTQSYRAFLDADVSPPGRLTSSGSSPRSASSSFPRGQEAPPYSWTPPPFFERGDGLVVLRTQGFVRWPSYVFPTESDRIISFLAFWPFLPPLPSAGAWRPPHSPYGSFSSSNLISPAASSWARPSTYDLPRGAVWYTVSPAAFWGCPGTSSGLCAWKGWVGGPDYWALALLRLRSKGGLQEGEVAAEALSTLLRFAYPKCDRGTRWS